MKKFRKFVSEYKQFGAALAVGLIALALDIIGSKNSGLRTTAHVLLITEALIMSLFLAKGMYEDIQDGSYGIDLLALTAIVTSVLLGEYWTAMITVLMLTGGEALEDYAENRAKTELTALLKKAPKTARLLRGRKTTVVPISELTIGQKIVIQPGDLVPVDCQIFEGRSSFDESSLTGESLPVDKTEGDELLSGSLNLEGVITAKVLRKAKDSQFEQILKLVKSAANSQAPFVRLADRYSIPFTFFSFALAIGVWIYTGDAIRFLEVLVVATPCPLLLGAPIGMISGMSRAAKHGIILKNGASLEKLAQAHTFAFDKTGTLTYGQPEIDQVITYGKYSRAEVLQTAVSLEQNSSHILAAAIVKKASDENIKIAKVSQQNEQPGRGIIGKMNGKEVLIGRLDYLLENVNAPSGFTAATASSMTTYVGVDGELIGSITFKDNVRNNSKKMLDALRKTRIKHILMLTGDNESVAKNIADGLGITEYVANCLPADKVKAIKDIDKNYKPIAFVGDGVNDAPVLVAADVGIALGKRGSAAASESADVVIMLDDVYKVAEAREIAKNTFKITKQSILAGIGMSIGLMFVFATGRFKPVYGAAIQELVDVTVILSALRAHGPFDKVEKLKKSLSR
ncbi:cadmium-translocating P-type ATPase [Candidatus Saccharibacteria bacterium]|nr:cadmium-translocating P-type ATPase [Candidatus Saccharibacteria bacterium]